MKVRKVRSLLLVCAVSMLLGGCTGNSNEIVYVNEEILENADVASFEEQEEESETCLYRKSGGVIEKYVVKNGIAIPAEVTKEEKEEYQLYTLLNGRILVWQDCFAGDTIDQSVWNIKEEEYKEKNTLISLTGEEDNLQIVDGILRILPQYVETDNECKWTTAGVDTQQNKQFFQGRVEVKVRSTNVTGQHSLVRTTGAWQEENNVPTGEIDIYEVWGDSKLAHYSVSSNLRYIDSLGKSIASTINEVRDYNNQLNEEMFHIVAMEWTKKKILVYIDNNLFAIYDIENGDYWRQEEGLETRCNPYHMPQYIDISAIPNLKVAADDEKQMALEIDWIRVYAPNEVKEFQDVVPTKLGIDYVYKVNKANSIPISAMHWSGNAGEEIYLGAIYLPDSVVDRTCIFSVDDESIATIDQAGKLTVLQSGTVSVTVTDVSSGLQATREIILEVEE